MVVAAGSGVKRPDRASAAASPDFELHGKLRRRQMTWARMRTTLIGVTAPRVDDDFGLGARQKSLKARAFIADLAVEAFAHAFQRPLARI
jgi:hypothetical protein